jgi:hypothetical protein
MDEAAHCSGTPASLAWIFCCSCTQVLLLLHSTLAAPALNLCHTCIKLCWYFSQCTLSATLCHSTKTGLPNRLLLSSDPSLRSAVSQVY